MGLTSFLQRLTTTVAQRRAQRKETITAEAKRRNDDADRAAYIAAKEQCREDERAMYAVLHERGAASRATRARKARTAWQAGGMRNIGVLNAGSGRFTWG